MVRRVVFLLAVVNTAACGIIAGLGDHHLREDGSATGADAQTEDVSGPPLTEDGDPPDPLDAADARDTTTVTNLDAGEDADACDDADAPEVLEGGDADDAADADEAGDAADAGDANDGASGLPLPIMIATNQSSPSMIVGGVNYVYWINEATTTTAGAIMRGAKNGTEVLTLASNRQKPIAIRQFGGTAYFTDDRVEPGLAGGLYAVDTMGVTLTQLATDDLGFGTMTIGTSNAFSEAYQNGSASIRRTSMTAPLGSPPCTTNTAVGRIPGIVLDSSGLYFIDDGANAIMLGSTSCNAGASVFAGGQPGVRALVARNGAIWWITATGLFMLPTNTPNGTVMTVGSGYTDLTAITTWSGGIAFVDGAAGNVYVCDGTTVSLVAKNQGDPRGIFVGTESVVFWTNHATGEVMKLAL